MQWSAVRKAEFRELIWQRSGLYSTSLLTVLDIQIQSHNLTLNSSSDLTSCQSHQLSLTSVTRSHLWKRPQFKLLLCSLILLFPIWRSCFYWWQQVLLTETPRKTVLTMTLWRQTPLLALHSSAAWSPLVSLPPGLHSLTSSRHSSLRKTNAAYSQSLILSTCLLFPECLSSLKLCLFHLYSHFNTPCTVVNCLKKPQLPLSI